jgi:hypothetical protein
MTFSRSLCSCYHPPLLLAPTSPTPSCNATPLLLALLHSHRRQAAAPDLGQLIRHTFYWSCYRTASYSAARAIAARHRCPRSRQRMGRTTHCHSAAHRAVVKGVTIAGRHRPSCSPTSTTTRSPHMHCPSTACQLLPLTARLTYQHQVPSARTCHHGPLLPVSLAPPQPPNLGCSPAMVLLNLFLPSWSLATTGLTGATTTLAMQGLPPLFHFLAESQGRIGAARFGPRVNSVLCEFPL